MSTEYHDDTPPTIPHPVLLPMIRAGQLERYFGFCECCEGDAMFGLFPYDPEPADYDYPHDEVYQCRTCGYLYGFDEAPLPYNEGCNDDVIEWEIDHGLPTLFAGKEEDAS